MKYLFTFLCCLVGLDGFAQEELPSYNEVIEVAGISRQELYARAQQWTKHLNYQISFDDPESGFISVGGEIGVRLPGSRKLDPGRLIYVITLIVEEQKYWYDVAQFYYPETHKGRKHKKAGKGTTDLPVLRNEAVYQALDAKVRSEIEDLKQSMLVKIYTPVDAASMGNR